MTLRVIVDADFASDSLVIEIIVMMFFDKLVFDPPSSAAAHTAAYQQDQQQNRSQADEHERPDGQEAPFVVAEFHAVTTRTLRSTIASLEGAEVLLLWLIAIVVAASLG